MAWRRIASIIMPIMSTHLSVTAQMLRATRPALTWQQLSSADANQLCPQFEASEDDAWLYTVSDQGPTGEGKTIEGDCLLVFAPSALLAEQRAGEILQDVARHSSNFMAVGAHVETGVSEAAND
jgi:hypothetical protein